MFNRTRITRAIVASLVIITVSAITFASPWTSALSFLGLASLESGSKVVSATGEPAFVVGSCDVATSGLPIEVESTLPSGPTAYANLGAAFAAINAGTHQGAINVEVCFNSTETAATVLNSSGAGSANYTSISIRPLADGLTISGPTVTGRGLIELNGADNVTIDGDNPNTVGINRNLTITNSAATATTFTSVIRIALATSVTTTADNISIKNLTLNGSATGRNGSTFTSTTGAETNTYGILASSGASTVSATTAPSAQTSLTAVIGSPATATNLQVLNNAITTVGRAVSIQGSSTTGFSGLQIMNNFIGNPTSGAASGVYTAGIAVQGSTNALISGNTVYVEGWLPSSSSGNNAAINVGMISSAVSGATIERNKVLRMWNNNSGGYPAFGINLGGGNDHLVRNNFVANVLDVANATFGSTFTAWGIRAGSGTGHVVTHNSVNMFGAQTGTGAALTAAFGVASTGQTGMSIQNNIFSNTVTGGGASTAHVSICLPNSGTSALNMTLNNNDYFSGSTSGVSGIAHVGFTYLSTPAGPGTYSGLYTSANFNSADTVNNLNLRTYTSLLSSFGTNDNSSKVVDPLFVSSTDLHIQTSSTMESAGANAGVATDIDGDSRGATPDIGADEITLAGPGTVQFSATSYTQPEGNTATITVNRTGGSSGAISVDYATSNSGGSVGGAACTAGVDYISTSGTLNWADTETAAKTFNVTLCNDSDSPETGEAVSLTLSNAVGTSITGTNPVPLNITDVPAMTYVSSTSTQVTGDVQLGGANQAIIGIQVVTTGSYLPLSVTQLNLSTNGSTAASDIANAKVYYTGTSSTFATGTQFGSTVASPSGAFNVTGTQALVAGTNYFWLAYDIAPTATVDNFVDAEVSSITVGSSQTPTVTAPAGNRQIKAVVTIPGANTNTGSQRYPLATYYGFQRSAAIYTSAELGLAPGSTIQNMCWYVNSSSSPGNAPTKIYMKTVTNSTFSAATTVANEEAGAMLTYNATPTLTYTANTWQCLALSTPFVYTGNNLQVLVETDQGSAGNEGSAAKQFRYSTAASAHQFWENDTAPPTGVSTTWSVGGISSNRPNIQFNFAAPIVAPGTVQFNPAAYTPNEGVVQTVTVTRTSGTAGAVSVDYATGGGTATPGTCGTDDYVATSGTLNWADGDSAAKTFNVTTCSDATSDPGETIDITLSNATGGVTIGGTNPGTITITDIPPPLNGDYQVPGDYATLTAAVADYNTRGVSGPVRFLLNNATYDTGSGETFPLVIATTGPDTTATNTLTIQPNTGITSAIVGSSASGIVVIGDQFVTINGDNVGGDLARNLTINNTATTGNSYVVGLFNFGGTKVARNATVRYSNIRGGATAVGTVTWGIILNGTGGDYDNVLIENNKIYQAYVGIGHYGVAATGINNNNVIRNNIIGDTTGSNESIKLRGIEVTQSDGLSITENEIFGNSAGNSNGQQAGVLLTNGSSNVSVTRNSIHDFYYTGTGGLGCFGVWVNAHSGTGTIANNMIHNIKGDGDVFGTATTNIQWMPAGIAIGANTGGTMNVDHNSVYMSGATLGSSFTGQSAAVSILSGLTGINLRNNALRNSMTTVGAPVAANKAYAVAFVGTGAANTAFATINHNDYFADGVNPHVGFAANADQTTIANWQTATAQDANSMSQDPQFISSTDLHLQVASPAVGTGTPIAAVTVDYDNDPRPASAPDIGADEIVQAAGGTFPAGSFYNASLIVGNTLAGDISVTNRLYLLGEVNVGSNTVTLGCNASVSGAGPATFINGAVKKDFCSTGAFEFPVGQNQYSKVGVTVTALGINPSSLTVTPYDATLGGFNPLTSLSRNWNLEETGDLTADLLFYYDDSDVNGAETDYRVYKREGNGIVTNMCTGGPCVDDLNNILGPISGVSDFSRWTGSGPLAPTAAEVSLGGRVTTADGRGIKNAVVVISGNTLAQPIMVKTGSFGYYRVDNLEAGEIYVVTVNSKRFLFTVPSRVVSVPDSVSNVDFVAMPEE